MQPFGGLTRARGRGPTTPACLQLIPLVRFRKRLEFAHGQDGHSFCWMHCTPSIMSSSKKILPAHRH